MVRIITYECQGSAFLFPSIPPIPSILFTILVPGTL